MKIYDILQIVYFAFFSLIFFPIGTAIYRWRNLSKTDKYVFYFLLGLLINEIIYTILQYMVIRNHFMNYSKTFLSTFFFFLFCYKNQVNNYEQKKMLIFATVIILLIPTEIIFITDFNQINTFSLTLSSIFICYYSFVGLKNIFDKKNFHMKLNSSLWHNVSFFIFGFFSIIPNFFEKNFVETSINLYYFFDTLKVVASGLSFLFFILAFKNMNNKPFFEIE